MKYRTLSSFYFRFFRVEIHHPPGEPVAFPGSDLTIRVDAMRTPLAHGEYSRSGQKNMVKNKSSQPTPATIK
jgi:hypothetical protein